MLTLNHTVPAYLLHLVDLRSRSGYT